MKVFYLAQENFGCVVYAETEKDAIELTENMDDSEFDWSDFDEAQVVDDDVDFE